MSFGIDPAIQEKWDYLITKFTPEYIESMSDPKEYVLGYGPDNESFCYLVEVYLKSLGDIRGSTAAKFGLWFGAYGQDKEKKLRATKQHFNGDINLAFLKIKNSLAKLIRVAQQLKDYKDIPSLIGGMFKRKIIYLYNPSIMLPVFSEQDMHYFEACLGITPTSSYESSQRNLLAFKKAKHPEMANHSFMLYLYDQYGRINTKAIREVNDFLDHELNLKASERDDPEGEYSTHPVKKAKAKLVNGVLTYPRDPKVASRALKEANHRCEYDGQHYCFLRKKDGKPYTEVHHLIPLAYYDDFNDSIDIPENVVSLCSNCHNEIHYGRNYEQLVRKLYESRVEKLKKANIEISLDELLAYYRK